MKNLLTTIPQRGDLRHWANVEKILQACDSEEDFWTFGCRYFPKESGPGALCFMVHSGYVRGYFTVLEFTEEDAWRCSEDQQEPELYQGPKVKLAVWRSIPTVPQRGFQGWRYTQLQP
ncbi:hypothetical protein [Hymenobacter guriensis]|uniref:Uncharacterized protein n=1 Tax=Hymenobacter guriensis TaxID=2793065 RepID=A0ABS0L4R0_9BACT|nr:hypothetical protein [Hymenobacter guriensis]MBG8555066.1 hypothetical protein [Hymenobacter guriensis]